MMTSTTASVVTPARFDASLTYPDFLAQAQVNRDKFEQNYPTTPLTDEDIVFFRRVAALPDGPAKVLAIAEAWCGDVFRELPTIARIADATGMTLRIVLRDTNPDIMDEYLSNDGRSRAIPVFIFYTKDHRYITHFTERAAVAHADLATARTEIAAQFPDADRQTTLRELVARVVPRFPAWRAEAIQEIRRLLSSALNLP
jgi:hypothetical protein